MNLSIYHTDTHSLGCISERGEALSSVRERTRCGDHLSCFQVFTAAIGAHSICEEIAGFYPLWFPLGKLFMSLVSCVY